MFDFFKKKQQTQNLNAFHPVINKMETIDGEIQQVANTVETLNTTTSNL